MEAGIFSYKGVMIQHLERFQDRPTIVFLHDSLGCIELWRDFPQKLADAADCNFLVYDRLGYGKSDPAPTNERSNNYMELEADFLNELLTELQLKDVVLFGHSDGGSIALIAAGKYPENIQAVIAEAAHIFVEDITLEGIDYAKSSYESLNMAERLAKYHGDKVDFVFSAWTETWMKPEFRSWNIEHFLPNISCPVLFIQGEDDEYGSLDQVNRTLEQVNGSAEKLILPEIGHTPHRESPKEVLEKASMFIWDL
jgi:pimeloyl-ACP methyl ester carboxylesterase